MSAEHRLSYCGQQVRLYDHDRYQICLMAGSRVREALFALLAFNLEVSKTADVVSEPITGMIRLQWWRESIETIYDPDATVRKHAVVEALDSAVTAFDLPRDLFERLINARERDLDGEPPADREDLLSYLDETSVPLVQLMLKVCSCSGCEGAAMATGRAWGLIGLVRSSAYLAQRKQIMFPRDEIDAAGLSLGDYHELRSTEALKTLVRSSCQLAEEELAKARQGLGRQKREALLPFMVLVHLDHYLAALKQADFDPFAMKGEEILKGATLWKLLWRLWLKKP
ncbi:phytoene/squalene synthase family protein [Kiloniella sp. b19]|uniref:phytoene/squalene synthase family protein n=1 Tax=Kiloniella sp. GXU_MW_B19 TaxID=3141326 RepID=UPI0031D9B9BF